MILHTLHERMNQISIACHRLPLPNRNWCVSPWLGLQWWLLRTSATWTRFKWVNVTKKGRFYTPSTNGWIRSVSHAMAFHCPIATNAYLRGLVCNDSFHARAPVRPNARWQRHGKKDLRRRRLLSIQNVGPKPTILRQNRTFDPSPRFLPGSWTMHEYSAV